MGAGVKDQIVAAIAATEDKNIKVVLLMMLGLLDEIGTKIDTVLNDEKGLRDAVLNGHEPVHNTHHEYIARRIIYEDDDAAQRRWVSRKMKEEMDDAKSDKDAKRSVKYNIIERVLWAVLTIIIGSLYVFHG